MVALAWVNLRGAGSYHALFSYPVTLGFGQLVVTFSLHQLVNAARDQLHLLRVLRPAQVGRPVIGAPLETSLAGGHSMARKSDARLLDAGDPFPPLELTLTDGRHLVLPLDLSQPYNAVLVNRGSWCPYCVTQLTGFQAGLTRLAQAGIGVVSLSADPREEAAALVAKHGLEFPVAYGASVHGVARALGGYYDPHPADRPPYLQSAGFVLGPDRSVLTAVYSSGAIGRLAWQDVLGFVQYVKAHP